ncbi:hypothetical protein Vadar_002540 [Vaccinium darrowii]|uniref:Uncharacterized protein n=1 Tax=Vaccinium darrowii TaxID=229202 RepID=A0ACB7Z349_9ERIC|nr:hypothetical protein Vadar_002540 [Vaccinium darrowii]
MSQRRQKPVTPFTPQSSSMPPPIWESQSTSTQVESNDIRQPTGDSSQANETNSVPLTGVAYKVNSDGDEIIDTSGLRGKNWLHFQKVKVKGTGALKARCLYCKKKLVAEQKSGTTHLADHYNSCLKRKIVDGNQKILTPSLMAGPGKKNTLQPYSYDPEYARQQLAYMIIMHEYPLNMVEHVGFRRFCYALQPSFQVVSRNTIKKDILNIYDVERLKTMRLMEKIEVEFP